MINKLLFAFILLLLLCSCQSRYLYVPKPSKDPAAEELKIPTESPEKIKVELKKLHSIPNTEYQIAPGDKFNINVYDFPELSSENNIVLPDGSIAIELVGTVNIANLTINEACLKISKKLSDFVRYPSVILKPAEIRGRTFTIVGKVVRPGVYPINNNTKLVDAIAIASGLSTDSDNSTTIEAADLVHSFIARNNKILPVDFVKAVRMGNSLNNIPIQNGDYLYISSNLEREVFVLGEVNDPGSVSWRNNLTLTQALAFAGNMTLEASKLAIIVRGNMADPKVYKVSAIKILRGQSYDFHLEPRDIVFFTRSDIDQYNDVINDLIPTAALINLISGIYSGTANSISIPVR